MVRTSRHWLVLSVLLFAACDSNKSANPLSPAVVGPIAGVAISTPGIVQPAIGADVTDEVALTLTVDNATTNGQRALTYTFELSAVADYSTKLFTREGVTPGDGGRTSVQMPDPLQAARTYYWRVRAVDGANSSDWGTAHFKVYTPVKLGVPVPLSPTGGVQLSTRRPQFRTRNIERSGPVGRFNYTFEIAMQDSFANKLAVVTAPEGNGETAFVLGQDLDYQQRYFWRVRAFDDQGYVSDWSAVNTFLSPNAPPSQFLLHGFVRDSESGGGLGGATVSIVDGPNANRSGTTDGNGYYTIRNLQASAFTLRASKSGYQLSDRPVGLYSDQQVDLSMKAIPKPPPAPSPSPSPGPAPGGPCNSSNPQLIVECERAKWGHMSSGQIVTFLIEVSKSLNRNGIGGGPFGILKKTGGHNCNGWSCDIVCAGQGNSQRQHDVLIDSDNAQIPTWGPPIQWPNIRIDTCAIQ